MTTQPILSRDPGMGEAYYRRALQAIMDGNIPRPVVTHWRRDRMLSTLDRCAHDRTMKEDCGNCVDAFIESVLTARTPDAGVVEAWQPIETAPRDELAMVLLWNGVEVTGGARWESGFADWLHSWMDPQPTHWMPHPPPPPSPPVLSSLPVEEE